MRVGAPPTAYGLPLATFRFGGFGSPVPNPTAAAPLETIDQITPAVECPEDTCILD